MIPDFWEPSGVHSVSLQPLGQGDALTALKAATHNTIREVRYPEACPAMYFELEVKCGSLDLNLNPPEYKHQWNIKVSCGVLLSARARHFSRKSLRL